MPGSNKKAAISVRWILLAFLLLLAVGYGVTYLQQQKSIDAAQQRIDELNNQLEEMRLTAAALESDLEFSKTDAYIERVARGELGYVKRGEIKFVESEDGAAQGSAAEPAASAEPTATTEPAAQPDDMKEPQQTDDPNPEGDN